MECLAPSDDAAASYQPFGNLDESEEAPERLDLCHEIGRFYQWRELDGGRRIGERTYDNDDYEYDEEYTSLVDEWTKNYDRYVCWVNAGCPDRARPYFWSSSGRPIWNLDELTDDERQIVMLLDPARAAAAVKHLNDEHDRVRDKQDRKFQEALARDHEEDRDLRSQPVAVRVPSGRFRSPRRRESRRSRAVRRARLVASRDGPSRSGDSDPEPPALVRRRLQLGGAR